MIPKIVSKPRIKARHIERLCVTSKKRRLSVWSATLPPINANRKNEAACANETAPSAIGELWVILSTSRLCVTIWSQVPTDETIKLIHKSRKLRCCRARNVCSRPLEGVASEECSGKEVVGIDSAVQSLSGNSL